MISTSVSTLTGLCVLTAILTACVAGEPAPPAPPALPPPELVWPNGAPGAKGEAPADKPEITIHLPAADKANGAAILICPGGGYGALMMTYEGHDIARWLNEQ